MEHNWSMEMEVVIIGYGGAGAAAAITAHDSGAEVIILEKMPAGGGNTRLCAGGLFSPTGSKAVDHVEALCFGKTNREVVQAYVEGCMTNNDWLREMGGKIEVHGANMLVMYPPMAFPSWPNVPGAEETGDICFCRVAEEPDAGEPAEGFNQWKGAEPLWRLLERNVERRGVRVMTNTPARELITNESGEVVGVLAERNGERISIKAKRGTILACGGFDNNDAMKDTFLPLTPLLSVGNPGNTGDAIVAR